ncbi:MAG: hypothetical protein Q9167_002786 [Letrouitia subvulpina]
MEQTSDRDLYEATHNHEQQSEQPRQPKQPAITESETTNLDNSYNHRVMCHMALEMVPILDSFDGWKDFDEKMRQFLILNGLGLTLKPQPTPLPVRTREKMILRLADFKSVDELFNKYLETVTAIEEIGGVLPQHFTIIVFLKALGPTFDTWRPSYINTHIIIPTETKEAVTLTEVFHAARDYELLRQTWEERDKLSAPAAASVSTYKPSSDNGNGYVKCNVARDLTDPKHSGGTSGYGRNMLWGASGHGRTVFRGMPSPETGEKLTVAFQRLDFPPNNGLLTLLRTIGAFWACFQGDLRH